MLLSRKEDGEIGRLVRRYNSEMTDETEARAAPSEVGAMVVRARNQGWFFSSNLVMQGGGSVATLLPLPRVNTMLAIGFGGIAQQMAEKVDDLREVLLRNVSAFEESFTTDL